VKLPALRAEKWRSTPGAPFVFIFHFAAAFGVCNFVTTGLHTIMRIRIGEIKTALLASVTTDAFLKIPAAKLIGTAAISSAISRSAAAV